MIFWKIGDDLWTSVQKYLPPTKPHIGRPQRDPRGPFNGILYVLTTGCTWHDLPAKYGTKLMVHRYHLELCKKGMYQTIFLDLLQTGYKIRKTRKIRDFLDKKLQGSFRVDLSHCAMDTKDIPAKNGSTGYDGYKKMNGNKLSALVDRNGLPLACTVALGNVHDSWL